MVAKNRGDSDVHVHAVPPSDQERALELVFVHLPPAERERAIAGVVAESRAAPLAGLWGAYRGEHLVAAVYVQIQPGKTAVVSTPRTTSDQPPEVIGKLLKRVVAELPSQGVKLAQALLETDSGADAEVLRNAGFQHASNLLYLVSLRGSFPTSRSPEPLEFIAYSPRDHLRLANVVEQTYTGSLDCPQLDRARDIEDVLAGYRATGVFDPARWMIVVHQGRDVGCLLLADYPPSNQWELVYMGVVPEARGRGFGVSIIRHAQWLAREAGRQRVVLAVDAANSPAIAVYASAGFVTWDHRSVFLRMY